MGKNTLMVIGNGFDLQCGLSSSYKKFFDWLSEDDARANDNVWAIHFLNKKCDGDGWADIESQLHKVLNEKSTRSNRNIGTYTNITETSLWGYIADSYFKLMEKGGGTVFPQGKEAEYIISYVKENGKESLPIGLNWFLDELKAFECQFSDYLQAEVDKSEEYYIANAIKLLNMMTNELRDKVYVLNFNYTSPFIQSSSEPALRKIYGIADNVVCVTNVHGTHKERNIIFGIDVVESTSNTYIFSKTYRKLLQRASNYILPSNVEDIKFYGHSLGQADYSYFQSIFDYYNLYDGNRAGNLSNIDPVTLQFYFTVFDENKKTVIKRNATDSIYRLISAYGDTLDNKDKGKNLLHKLLLESRIQIKFLENINIAQD